MLVAIPLLGSLVWRLAQRIGAKGNMDFLVGPGIGLGALLVCVVPLVCRAASNRVLRRNGTRADNDPDVFREALIALNAGTLTEDARVVERETAVAEGASRPTFKPQWTAPAGSKRWIPTMTPKHEIIKASLFVLLVGVASVGFQREHDPMAVQLIFVAALLSAMILFFWLLLKWILYFALTHEARLTPRPPWDGSADRCFYCAKASATHMVHYPFFREKKRELLKDYGSVQEVKVAFESRTLQIPRCAACAALHESEKAKVFWFCVKCLLGMMVPCLFAYLGSLIGWPRVFFLLGGLIGVLLIAYAFIVGIRSDYRSRGIRRLQDIGDHPENVTLVENDFIPGQRPS